MWACGKMAFAARMLGLRAMSTKPQSGKAPVLPRLRDIPRMPAMPRWLEGELKINYEAHHEEYWKLVHAHKKLELSLHARLTDQAGEINVSSFSAEDLVELKGNFLPTC